MILGIDYGEKKIGAAIATKDLAEPYLVIEADKLYNAAGKVAALAKLLSAEKIVIGLSEGETAKKTKKFAEKLKKRVDVEIVFQDETLTTKDAQSMAIEAGMKRKKRKEMENAFAASLILQNYLDSQR